MKVDYLVKKKKNDRIKLKLVGVIVKQGTEGA